MGKKFKWFLKVIYAGEQEREFFGSQEEAIEQLESITERLEEAGFVIDNTVMEITE